MSSNSNSNGGDCKFPKREREPQKAGTSKSQSVTTDHLRKKRKLDESVPARKRLGSRAVGRNGFSKYVKPGGGHYYTSTNVTPEEAAMFDTDDEEEEEQEFINLDDIEFFDERPPDDPDFEIVEYDAPEWEPNDEYSDEVIAHDEEEERALERAINQKLNAQRK